MTAPKTHPCYCVFGPDDRPVWSTVRPTEHEAVAVFVDPTIKLLCGACPGVNYTDASQRIWHDRLHVGYTVRETTLTEVK